MIIETLRLSDGRRLAYATEGEDADPPVLFCHGMPGSALGLPPGIKRVFAEQRIIIPERPGYGASGPAPNASLTDWASDAESLLDHLGVRSCGVVGYSGGSAFALACAYRLRDRVTDVSLFSSIAPLQSPHLTAGMCSGVRTLFAAANGEPDALVRQWENADLSVEQMLDGFLAEMAPEDRAAATDPAVRHPLLVDFERALSPGYGGLLADLQKLGRPWGFPLEHVRTPTTLWHGVADRNTPPAMSAYLASVLPEAKLNRQPGHGHLMSFGHFPEMVQRPDSSNPPSSSTE